MTIRTIWKTIIPQYPGTHQITIPEDSKLLSAAEQMGSLTVWFSCDPTRKRVAKSVIVVYTGQEYDHEPIGEFVATVLLGTGTVVHLFDPN